MRFIKTLLLTALLTLSLQARERVNVNFDDLQINDFIKLVSKVTHKNILINNRINGTVNFISTTPVYDDELIGILVSVLESKGYTLVKHGSLYQVLRSTEAAKHNVAVIKQGKHLYGSLMVTQTLHIKAENVDIVAAKIRYLISKTAKLMTMKESNTLIITDYPKNIETIKRVIKDIDTNSRAIVKIISIKHANAKSLQTKLVNISKSIFNQKVVADTVKIILDENINALIVVGIQKNVTKIEALVKKMDVESHVSKGVQIFELKNSDAKTVAVSLNEIIAKQVFSDPSLKPNISASEEINAIIAIGDPTILKGIKLIIDELDKEKYQVYVKARIIEINEKNAESIGVKYGFDGGGLSNGGLYTLSGNFGGSSIAVSKEILDSIGGISGANFALGATIDFLEQNGASKSVSNPSILCVNNKQSSIYVGKTISISNGTTSNAVSGTTQNIKREDIGLTLKIKPRVSSSDKVTLEVETVLENILDDGLNSDGVAIRQPVTSKQEIKTQTILRHGENIIIGGLVKTYDVKNVSKIPLLGDIPWIGKYLFSSTTVKEEQDNLIVILTPYIIDKSEKLSKLQKALGELEILQKVYDKKVFRELEKKDNTEIEKKENTVIEEK